MTRWLVTGAAGFIGFHVAERLTAEGEDVLGIDNLDDYYDPALKKARLEQLARRPNFEFRYIDLTDAGAVAHTFESAKPHTVIHMAAQAGVRHSLHRPIEYVDANVVGFMHLLEGCRHHDVGHLVYASSSSIYGVTSRTPFSEHHPADHPVSIYAATKRAGELMAHTYSHLFELPATGLRFFTVYGPWGRPDMAYFKFAEQILAGEPITVFGDGQALRDFTYIDDIVEGVVRIAREPPPPTPNGPDRIPIQPRAGTRGGCSTSATANRSPSTVSSSCLRNCWTGPPSAFTPASRRATCPPPTPTPPTWREPSTSRLPLASRTVLHGSPGGCAIITMCDEDGSDDQATAVSPLLASGA